MQACVGIALGIELHHPAHFSSVLRGKAGGVDAHRIQIIGPNLRTKAWGAIVSERNSVNDELRLIFRAAWMQHRIPFVEPSRLGVHEILHRSARQTTARDPRSAWSRSA